MPHSNTWETDGLYRKFIGKISAYEILESNINLHQDSNFSYIKYVINDFSEVTQHSIEVTHTRIYASTDRLISDYKEALKIALVVTQAELLALANRYCEQMIDEKFECQIFKTIEEARAWTGVDKEKHGIRSCIVPDRLTKSNNET